MTPEGQFERDVLKALRDQLPVRDLPNNLFVAQFLQEPRLGIHVLRVLSDFFRELNVTGLDRLHGIPSDQPASRPGDL
jgi:hypothetical protein